MTTTKAQRCPSCGAADSITPTTPSRTITYRSVSVTLPPLSLPECASCHDMLLDDAQSDIYSDAIDVAYAAAVAESQPSWLSILSPSDRALFFKEVAEAQERGESVDVLIQQWENTAFAVAAGIDSSPLDPDDWSHSFEPIGISSAAEAAAVQALIDNPPPPTERLKAAMKPGPASTRRLPSTTPTTSITDDEPG